MIFPISRDPQRRPTESEEEYRLRVYQYWTTRRLVDNPLWFGPKFVEHWYEDTKVSQASKYVSGQYTEDTGAGERLFDLLTESPVAAFLTAPIKETVSWLVSGGIAGVGLTLGELMRGILTLANTHTAPIDPLYARPYDAGPAHWVSLTPTFQQTYSSFWNVNKWHPNEPVGSFWYTIFDPVILGEVVQSLSLE